MSVCISDKIWSEDFQLHKPQFKFCNRCEDLNVNGHFCVFFLHNKIGRPSFSYTNFAILKFKCFFFVNVKIYQPLHPFLYLNFIPHFHSAQFNVGVHKLYAKMCHFHLIVVTQFFFYLNKIFMNGTEQNNSSNNYTREREWDGRKWQEFLCRHIYIYIYLRHIKVITLFIVSYHCSLFPHRNIFTFYEKNITLFITGMQKNDFTFTLTYLPRVFFFSFPFEFKCEVDWNHVNLLYGWCHSTNFDLTIRYLKLPYIVNIQWILKCKTDEIWRNEWFMKSLRFIINWGNINVWDVYMNYIRISSTNLRNKMPKLKLASG